MTFKFLFRKGCCFFFPQLGQLLRQAAERGDQGFDPSTALFVCNWWDQVKLHEQDHVLQETLRRLSRVLPGLGRQQVFPLSSTEVCQCPHLASLPIHCKAVVIYLLVLHRCG